MKLFSVTMLNIATQISLALHLALLTSFFEPSAAALFLGAYIYRDVVLHANIGELQALLFAKKYDDISINVRKLFLFLSVSLAQLSGWLLLLVYFNLPQFVIVIILIEYLMFYPINLLKGYGKIKEALTLQFITSLCGLLSVSLSFALGIKDIEFYMQTRALIAFLLLIVIILLVNTHIKNLIKTSKKILNKKIQLKDGFFLQAKELYLLALLTTPKFIAFNILEPRLFTAFMVAFAAMSACSSLLQTMHQGNLYKRLNGIQAIDTQTSNFFGQLLLAFLATVLCYFAGVFWINKDFTLLTLHELEPIIILLYIAPLLLMPIIFLKFRTESYNTYYIVPIATLMSGLYISTFTSNIGWQILLMMITVLLIFFVAKTKSSKSFINIHGA